MDTVLAHEWDRVMISLYERSGAAAESSCGFETPGNIRQICDPILLYKETVTALHTLIIRHYLLKRA
jgi:hypothetical protein